MDKIYVNIFVPALDQSFDIELPINLEMKYAIDNIQNAIKEITEDTYVVKKEIQLFDKSTGDLINMNNIVKYSGLKNGSSIMLV